MATIRVFKDALKRDPEVTVTDGEICLLEWIAKHYPNLGELSVQVQLNGKAVADTNKHTSEEMAEATKIKVGLFDSVDIIVRPEGVAAAIITSVVLSLVQIALAPEPEIPNNLGKQSDSPNNQLNAAQNAFRPRQAIPDIAGQVVSYPDFLQNSYYIYENNKKIFTEVFCIGVDYHDVDEVKDGESPFSDSESNSFAVYSPNDTVPTLADVRASNNVDGQEILPPDSSSATADITGSTISAPDTISGVDPSSIDLSSGDQLAVDITWNGGSDSLNGTFTVASVTETSITLSGVTLSGSASPGDVSGTITNNSSQALGFWTTLVGDDIEEIRFHLNAPQGIRSENNDFLSVRMAIEAEKLDSSGNPTGVVLTKSIGISGSTLDPQFRTFILDSNDGITIGGYRARVIRETNEEPAPGIDLIKFERLESVRYYTPAFGSVTTLITNRRATTQPTSGRQSKTNALVTRRLELFDPDTGTFDDGTFIATRSFAQYVMYLLCKLGNVPIENVAYQELFDIDENLSDAQLGYFDFTFDSSDVSLLQRVDSCCNAARVKRYNVGNVWRFVREEAKQVRQALFNRRNVAPASSSISYEAFVDEDYDSYELEYVDPDTNSEAYIRRRINSSGNIENGLGNRVKRKPLAGCRNVLQATNRCELEVRRIRDQRIAVTDKVMQDALRVGVGSRVGWADINDDDYFHGEILDQDGDVFTTSEPFEPESGVTYYVYITDQTGTTSNSVVATARSDGNKYGFEASGLTAYTADGYAIQLGSMYVIASSAEANDFIMTYRGAPDEENMCEIRLSNYKASMFEAD